MLQVSPQEVVVRIPGAFLAENDSEAKAPATLSAKIAGSQKKFDKTRVSATFKKKTGALTVRVGLV